MLYTLRKFRKDRDVERMSGIITIPVRYGIRCRGKRLGDARRYRDSNNNLGITFFFLESTRMFGTRV